MTTLYGSSEYPDETGVGTTQTISVTQSYLTTPYRQDEESGECSRSHWQILNAKK